MHECWTLRRNFFSSDLEEEGTKEARDEWDWFEDTFHVGRDVGGLIVSNSQFMKKFTDVEMWNTLQLVDAVYEQAVREVKRNLKRRNTMGTELVGAREEEEEMINYSMTVSTEDFIQKRQSAMARFGRAEP